MTMTDFRALCEDLVDGFSAWTGYGGESDFDGVHALIDRARAALAEQTPSLKVLKEQALKDLNHAYKKDQIDDITFENIQEALEALPND